ncbi:MAG: radical SAM protein [Lachnospiraceae bacterium]|jgi:putative pyruvate formate lyase activating enzyme|nr:radical SAM protein [Lachnospiraceae bacterium]
MCDKINLGSCRLCPRRCGVNRLQAAGFCGAGAQMRVAKAMLHHGEEPCIGGEAGAGAVFFSGCNLRCVFCQNYEISWENHGWPVSEARLAEILLHLQEQGACCIDLVSPTPYTLQLKAVLTAVKPELRIPVVYNCGGYEEPEALRLLEGLIDVYLPDLKYFDRGVAARYCGCADYFEKAQAALQEMYRQVGACELDAQGLLRKGLLVRHLVLPGAYKDSMELMKWLGEAFPAESIRMSLLSQYTPFGRAEEYPEINRRVTTYEYEKVIDQALASGLIGYRQERSSSTMALRPEFDGEGIL